MAKIDYIFTTVCKYIKNIFNKNMYCYCLMFMFKSDNHVWWKKIFFSEIYFRF